MGTKEFKVLLRCFFRTYLIGSMYNTKGLQNLGLLYVMDPGLKMFYRDRPDEYLEARKRYLTHYNSHPYFLPFLVGYFLFLESRICQKVIGPDSLNAVKETSAYTLSALGDSLFGGSLLVLWGLVEVLFILYGLKKIAIFFFLFSFLLLQLFRFVMFWKGWSEGLLFFQFLKDINLIEWSNRIKMLNALILVWIWYKISCLTSYNHLLFFWGGGVFLTIFSFLVYKHILSREMVVGLFVIFLLFL